MWYLFATDVELAAAREGGLVDQIMTETRRQLLLAGYPAEVLSEACVSFTSREDIQRETGGNYWDYFK